MLMPVISRARSERAKRVGQIRYLLRSDLHIARSSARSQSCYGAVLPMKYRLLRTPTDGPRTSRSLTRKLRGQIPASMPGRVIQERLGPAIRGLNVKHDLDIEPATGSVSSLPGNVCLTCSGGLLIGYKVARQFESHSLRQRVACSRSRKRSGALLPCLPNPLTGTRNYSVTIFTRWPATSFAFVSRPFSTQNLSVR